MLVLMTLLACSGRSPSDDSANATPTDSFPSFYGSAPKNLLVISLDTFRRDYMGRYGDTRNLMPFLDSLANQGVALDNHAQFRGCIFMLLRRHTISSSMPFRKIPRPVADTSTTSPGFKYFGGSKRAPAPVGVPVTMMSPGCKVMNVEI